MRYHSPSHLLYAQETGKQPEQGKYGKCVMCGGTHYPLAEQIGKVVSGNYTAWSKLHDGDGRVCEACQFALKKHEFRAWSFLATPTRLVKLDKTNTVDTLLNPPEDEPFIIVITTSHKKHLWPMATVNQGNGVIIVQFDEMHVSWEPESCGELLEKVERLYAVLNREEIYTLSPGAAKGKKMTQELWEIVEYLKKEGLQKTKLLKFLAFIARKEV